MHNTTQSCVNNTEVINFPFPLSDLITCAKHLSIKSAITPAEQQPQTYCYPDGRQYPDTDTSSEGSDRDNMELDLDVIDFGGEGTESEEEEEEEDCCDECEHRNHVALLDSLPVPVLAGQFSGKITIQSRYSLS